MTRADGPQSSTCRTKPNPDQVIRDTSVRDNPLLPNPEYDMPGYLMTDDQIRQLAIDVRAGAIFGSWCFRNLDERDRLLHQVFKQRGQPINPSVGYLYQFRAYAGIAQVEGYPVFYWWEVLTWVDANRLNDEIARQARAEGALEYPQVYEPMRTVPRQPWWRRWFT